MTDPVSSTHIIYITTLQSMPSKNKTPFKDDREKRGENWKLYENHTSSFALTGKREVQNNSYKIHLLPYGNQIPACISIMLHHPFPSTPKLENLKREKEMGNSEFCKDKKWIHAERFDSQNLLNFWWARVIISPPPLSLLKKAQTILVKGVHGPVQFGLG